MFDVGLCKHMRALAVTRKLMLDKLQAAFKRCTQHAVHARQTPPHRLLGLQAYRNI